MTLTEFILARLAEDAADAETKHDTAYHDYENCHCDYPARVLADVEAKKVIVERCAAVDYAMPSTHLAHGILSELALPYADHPSYDESWRP